MKLLLPILHLLLLSLLPSSAHRVSFKQIKQSPSLQRRAPPDSQTSISGNDNKNVQDLTSVHDLVYLVDLTVGGVDYPVQLDTGSSDLWIKGNSTVPLPNVTRTETIYNLTYAVGWAAGYLAYAPIEFAGLSVPQQAFLDATEVNNPAISYGARGIAGLGFTSLSAIHVQGNHSNPDRSLLYNLFEANPSEPNFIGFILQRNNTKSGEAEGSFSIGEFEPDYDDIADTEPIPTWPVKSPKRWTILLDAVIVVDNIVVPTTSVIEAPSNKAVVLMDSGSSYTYAPKAIVDAIYSNATGAHFDTALGQWVVPCDYEVNMALQMGGQLFPVHPLDLTPHLSGDPTKCVGSFMPGTFSTGAGEFDWLVGDNFLRSVYAVYDFGDFDKSGTMGDPYMRLLSTVDPDQASIDFHKVRGGTPKTNITYTGLNGVAIEPVFSLSKDVTESIQLLGKFVPAMMAVVAFNALVLMGLILAGVIYLCRRRRRNVRSRPNRGRVSPMSPMPMNPRNSYIAGVEPSQRPHAYEPVSMALTEDTLFVPPSPAFRKFEDGTMRHGDRPKSVA
ncbi:hypothetical protein AMATHDRAFT_1778 [Amanita thiersii Skay4041]|uniref:Peptidase A1 domain-containing protein n=1 Tax=Amanita thiersii Skay4041 TaxID=703135 RepID=A0A2A9NXV9_9AGAR|nr:hypothetical protein AMATHDRAFT_1778 [Amanita thiersii Skay4041]